MCQHLYQVVKRTSVHQAQQYHNQLHSSPQLNSNSQGYHVKRNHQFLTNRTLKDQLTKWKCTQSITREPNNHHSTKNHRESTLVWTIIIKLTSSRISHPVLRGTWPWLWTNHHSSLEKRKLYSRNKHLWRTASYIPHGIPTQTKPPLQLPYSRRLWALLALTKASS